jgi:hypothetical protein
MTNMYHKWSYKVNIDEIKIDDFIYRPADAPKITALLGFAGSMSEMKTLPPTIEDPPFIIEFSEDGGLTLNSGNGGSVKFSFADIDTLINLVDDLVKVAIDQHTLRPRGRAIGSVSTMPGEGDVIIGRN